MIRKSRFVVPALAFVLAVSACGGGGQAPEERAEVVERLERLGHSNEVAECMVDRFDEAYTAADIDIYISARDDLSEVDFQLIEDMLSAVAACNEEE